jgi:hypothetical protein
MYTLTREDLMDRITVLANGCWKWPGAKSKDGYGVLRAGGKQQSARRVFWETFVGALPVDHVLAPRFSPPRCIGRLCCNPDHMITRDKTSPVCWGTCPNGHKLTPATVVRQKETGRNEAIRCYLCRLEYFRVRMAGKRAAKNKA